MSQKKFKYNDLVRITNPEFFVRCGYNETISSAEDKLNKKYKNADNNLMELFDFLEKEDLRKIKYVISKIYNKRVLEFGGPERKIFVKRVPELLNQKSTITSIRPIIHKTGIRCPGYRPYRYDYDDDCYEPPYLSQQKTHVFYEIYPLCYGSIMETNTFIIENTNIEPLT